MAGNTPNLAEDTRNDGPIAVGATAILLSPAKKRQECFITNTSAAGHTVSISFGKKATAGAGIVIQPGMVYFTVQDPKFTPSQMDLWVIGTAGSTVAIFER